jgi:hypothetical protein
MFECTFDREQHLIIRPTMVGALRDQINRKEDKERLFMYYHLKHGTFVIAWWTNPARGRFVDMENLGTSLCTMTRATFQDVIRRANYPQSKSDSVLQGVKQAQRRYDSYMDNMLGRQSDEMTWNIQKGKLPVAY